MSPRSILRGGAAAALPLRGFCLRARSSRGQRRDASEQLDEFRKRTISSLMVLGLAFGVAFALHGRLIELLNAPLGGAEPVTLGVTEPFLTALKVSMFAAFGATFPVLMWHIWRFVAPSVDVHTRRTVTTYVAAGSLLMGTGIVFAYLVALPSAVNFLTGFDEQIYDIQVRAQEYYVFACAVLLSVGLVFQLPVVLLALVRFRVLTHERLSGNRKIAYVALMALAVLMPGVDPVTTLMWILPLGLMFEVSVLLARRVERRARRSQWESAVIEFDERRSPVPTSTT